MKPTYYKAIWHNCTRCKIHYMSEEPHLRAYLCDECWNSIPHYVAKVPILKHSRKKIKNNDWNWKEIALYTIGNLCCLIVIGYYLLFK
jgi:hypothetical protein